MNRNEAWARAIVQELHRSRVQHVCVSPGSRSAPLVLALSAEPGLRASTHLDERAAGFFAVGLARATRRPVALVCTSGTAAANYLPAVVEANHAALPLVVLTADRPPELHGVGANQSIDQDGLYGAHVRWAPDVGTPEATPAALRNLRSIIARAVARARGPPAGPVHLNLPFREPLTPAEGADPVAAGDLRADPLAFEGRPDHRPWIDAAGPTLAPDASAVASLADRLARTPRGLIVCGPRETDDTFATLVTALAQRLGYPILADALSGVRFGVPSDAPVVSGYDMALLHGPTRIRLQPEIVLRFGASPTSKSLLAFVKTVPTKAVVDETGRRWDETGADTIVTGDAALVAEALLASLPRAAPDSAWADAWRAMDEAVWTATEAELSTRSFEGAFVAHVVRTLPPGASLFVGNSLPVRDLERFARARATPLRVMANRGASGIDGVLSSGLGAAYGLAQPTTILLGDLSFLHDLNGLTAAARLGLAPDIIVLNNDGGGVFEFLPVARHEPPFTELFVTPHGLALEPLARAFGLLASRVDSVKALAEARQRAVEPPGRLLEVLSDRKRNVEHRRAVEARVVAALDRLEEERLHAH